MDEQDEPKPRRCNQCGGEYPCRGVLWGTHTFKGDPPPDPEAVEQAIRVMEAQDVH